MGRPSTIALVILLAFPNSVFSYPPGHYSALRAPDLSKVNIEFSERVTSGDAARDYAEMLAKPQIGQPTACSFGGSPGYQCVQKGSAFFPNTYFLPPFPLVLPQRVPPERGFPKPKFSWVPVHEAQGGLQKVAEWQDLARRGKGFACGGPECIVIIATHFKRETLSETVLESCLVYNIVGTRGAPWDCRAIAILGVEHTWVYAYVSYEDVHPAPPVFDFDLRLVEDPLPPISSVLTAAQNALETPPLNLIAEKITSSAVAGNGQYRVSSVLPGWHELVTVRADIDDECDGCLGVKIFTTLYVNRQNTDRPEDWHLPSERQGQTYLNAVRHSFKQPLQSLCTNSKWTDDRTLVCGVPAPHR